jgi:glycerol-3-phosphate cytidylyltransferase-like family protein
MSTTVISEYFPSLYCETLHASTEINVLCRDRLKEQQTNLIPSICFYNGCFAPIHAGHLNVLEEAQRYINNLGTHELLGAYISPAHAGYVASKLCAEDRFGTGHRLAMIQLAINKFDWVMIDLFEIFQPHSIALSTIMENFASRVHSSLPNGKQIEIFWLQGENKLFYTVPEKLLQLGYHCLYVINCGLNENNSSKIQTQTYSSYSERYDC